MKVQRNERGQTTIVFAVFLALVFLGMGALAIDVGILYRQKRMVQAAADAAAIAASAQYGTTDINTSAKAAAQQQAGGILSGDVTATLKSAATSDVQVVVTHSAQTYFLSMVNSAWSNINVSALGEAAKPPSNSCINSLSPNGVTAGNYPLNGCSSTGGIVAANSGYPNPQIGTTGCGICADSAIVGCGNGTGISTDSSISAGGGASGKVTASGGINGAGNCVDPYAAVTPPVVNSGCKAITWPNGTNGGQNLVLPSNGGAGDSPYCDFGVASCSYCLGGGSLKLSGGLYIFKGEFNIGSGVPITATAPVTLYFAPGSNLNGGNGSVQRGFDNGMSINITAMTTGPTAGIAIWDNSGTATSPDTMTFNGGSSSKISGAIYAPHTIIQDGNGSGVATVDGSITAWAIEVGGSGGLSVSNSGGGAAAGNVTLIQ